MGEEPEEDQVTTPDLAARLSALEGSTRAALQRIDTALARHDGDVAELRAALADSQRISSERATALEAVAHERDALLERVDAREFHDDLVVKACEAVDRVHGTHGDGSWATFRVRLVDALRERMAQPAQVLALADAAMTGPSERDADDLRRSLEIWQQTAAELEQERDAACERAEQMERERDRMREERDMAESENDQIWEILRTRRET